MTASSSFCLCRCAGAGSGGRRGRGLFRHLLGRGFLQHLAGGKLAVAEAGVEILDLAQPVFAGHAFQFGLLNPAELHAQAARFLFEILLADLDGALALVGVDDVLDLVARARSLDDRQPVLARLMAGLRQDVDNIAVAQHVAQRHDAAVDLRARCRCCRLRSAPRRRNRSELEPAGRTMTRPLGVKQ